VSGFTVQLDNHEALNQLLVPDLWQHEAITHLRQGKDVVVNAPTGSGKTLIFELWANEGRPRGQAVYTVPTRALANDKRAEWLHKGWDVGITTGDLSENIGAPIIVATLEAQKNRLLRGEGPALLVVDEYQMIRDSDRGLNYELAIAQTPPDTQLLLLSGSVSNPDHVADWLNRLGLSAVAVSHHHRPVPLEEVYPMNLRYDLPKRISGYWSGLVAKALAEDLGPILIFAPRRAAAEKLAGELSRQLPNPHPLELTEDQEHLLGDKLTKMVTTRIAYHHSGLSYAARAGVLEPLAKAGQLRAVVATMGLAAGINFSLRSVSLAADSYRRNYQEQTLAPDEILQMLGRAGRRGIDETGYVLISANQVRLRDGYAVEAERSRLIDWSALLGIMSHAVDAGQSPFEAASRIQARLFSTKPIALGIEHVLRHPDTPCELSTDSERARRARSQVKEFLNSRGEWDLMGEPQLTPLAEAFVPLYAKPLPRETPYTSQTPLELPDSPPPKLIPALSHAKAVASVTEGPLTREQRRRDGESITQFIKAADRLENNRLMLTKRIRRLTKWKGRYVSQRRWEEKLVPLIQDTLLELETPAIGFDEIEGEIHVEVSLQQRKIETQTDRHGIPLWKPYLRHVPHPTCRSCALFTECQTLDPATGTVLLWRRLGLIDSQGAPTRRGRIVSFFGQSDGLALAAALEATDFAIEDLIFEIANLDGGFRFSEDDHRWGGRIAEQCRKVYGSMNIAGYLENGLPPSYGNGASRIIRSIYRHPHSKQQWTSDQLGIGDIDRIVIEWRSRLRQIANAPDLDWNRWTAFKQLATKTLNETESPTQTDLPPLSHHQKQRISHRLHPGHLR
jgi:superfamily II DNA/RNA helicase